jgi:hypothetical protein
MISDTPSRGASIFTWAVRGLTIALLFAAVPYFIFRWIVEIIARRGLARQGKAIP